MNEEMEISLRKDSVHIHCVINADSSTTLGNPGWFSVKDVIYIRHEVKSRSGWSSVTNILNWMKTIFRPKNCIIILLLFNNQLAFQKKQYDYCGNRIFPPCLFKVFGKICYQFRPCISPALLDSNNCDVIPSGVGGTLFTECNGLSLPQIPLTRGIIPHWLTLKYSILLCCYLRTLLTRR